MAFHPRLWAHVHAIPTARGSTLYNDLLHPVESTTRQTEHHADTCFARCSQSFSRNHARAGGYKYYWDLCFASQLFLLLLTLAYTDDLDLCTALWSHYALLSLLTWSDPPPEYYWRRVQLLHVPHFSEKSNHWECKDACPSGQIWGVSQWNEKRRGRVWYDQPQNVPRQPKPSVQFDFPAHPCHHANTEPDWCTNWLATIQSMCSQGRLNAQQDHK